MAATAAVAAILARGANGAGQAVEVSLLAGAFSLHTGGILRHEKMTALYHGPQDPLGPIPVYRLFEAADGKYSLRRMRQLDLLGQVRDRNRSSRSRRRPAFRKCAVGNRARALAAAQGHHRADYPHAPARRMAEHPARGRRSMRAGDVAPGVHRSSTDARARDAPRNRRPHSRPHDSDGTAGVPQRHSRRNQRGRRLKNGDDRAALQWLRRAKARFIAEKRCCTSLKNLRSMASPCSTSPATSRVRTAR